MGFSKYTYDYSDNNLHDGSRLKNRKSPRLRIDDENSHRELIYAIHLDSRQKYSPDGMVMSIWQRDIAPEGIPTRAIQAYHPENDFFVPAPSDATIVGLLLPYRQDDKNRYHIPSDKLNRIISVLPLAQQLRILDESIVPRKFSRLYIDASVPRHIKVSILEADTLYSLSPYIATSRKIPASDWKFYWKGGYLLAENIIFRISDVHAESYIRDWLHGIPSRLDAINVAGIIKNIMLGTMLEITDLPESLRPAQKSEITPTGMLHFSTAKFLYNGKEQLNAELMFNYNGVICHEQDKGQALTTGKSGILIARKPIDEENLKKRLLKLGFRQPSPKNGEEPGLKLPPAKLPDIVEILVLENWKITANGKTYRRPIEKKLSISTSPQHTDWFEIEGGFEYDGQTVPFPKLLMALRTGNRTIRLDDGTYGILPEDWLLHYTPLMEIGELAQDNTRIIIKKSQAALIAAILDKRKIETDGNFQQQVKKWQEMLQAPIQEIDQPAEISATLRPYQKDGLKWLYKLESTGFGGCLADDMGLGKTLQVITLLQLFKNRHAKLRAIIVLPSTLIFNWQNEIEKFAPDLRTATYFGPERTKYLESTNWDILFTTYGILRMDATKLATLDFDYAILDEAQAIKNANSQTAAAAKCLNAAHRLTLTGTPIENSIAELFSQLDFLNPGLFGAAFIKNATKTTATLNHDALMRLQNFLCPFLLRRKKEDVAKDLPQKTEQILWCELEGEQKGKYEELRNYYQTQFADNAENGTASAKDMLQALLRLRQTACHPALVNPASNSNSAKLDLLKQLLPNIINAGHKVLVFSQFTSFLRRTENLITEHGWKACYLDGQSKDRKALVEQFQNDADTKIFLISLKAGGTGLNLTAADYVFILDPWWNPAAEAQAIDRAYRIGQDKPVFAYKIIAKNTVEEKIHNLQLSKQCLADSILANASKPATLTAEELKKILKG